MLLEKGRDVLHTARELEKQAVRLQQGWENALILNVDATFPFPLLAPRLRRFITSITPPALNSAAIPLAQTGRC